MPILSRHALNIQCSLAAILLSILLGGCSIDYNEAMIAENLAEDIPDTILYDFTRVEVKDGKPLYRLQAEKAESFEKQYISNLTSVLFQEFDEEGEIITEGQADMVTYFTNTENAEMEGDLTFYSKREGGSVSGEYLFWENETKILKSKTEYTVELEKDSGSTITGTGFEADFTTEHIIFTGKTEGTWVDEEEDSAGSGSEQ